MNDDHDTLRDVDGRPMTYKALGPDSVPLAVSQVWPASMTDREAALFAADIEWGRARPGGYGLDRPRNWHYVGLRGQVPLGRCDGVHDGTDCNLCGARL